MSPAKAPLLEAIEISKSYGARLALDNVSLAVRPGEIAALLGPNGAGKTTTLSILATLLKPDSGHVLINGKPRKSDPTGLGRMLGLVPQSLALYPTLSAAQNVWHFARMQGLSHNDAIEHCKRALDEVGLGDRADDPMHCVLRWDEAPAQPGLWNCSSSAPCLLLDEPTVGVDLQSREQLLALIRHYADAGAGVIYSTHYMEEAERICDRVLLIDRGKLIAEGDLEKVISLGGSRPRIELTYRGQLPDGRFGSLAGVREIGTTVSEGKAILEMNSFAQVAEVLHGLRTLDVNVVDFNLHSPNLSDAFIALTGHTLRDQVL